MVLFWPFTALAREVPEINWIPEVFSVYQSDEGDSVQLLNDGSRQVIAEDISHILHRMRDNGSIPFRLKETDQEVNAEDAMNTVYGIIPIVMMDTSFDQTFHLAGHDYYKAEIISCLDLALCSMDEEANTWRVLGVIPMRSYGVLGQSNLWETPVDLEQKRQMYVQITEKSLEQNLTASHLKNLLKGIDWKSQTEDTYQVISVDMTSCGARELFGARQQDIQNLVGSFYTSKYQQVTQNIVYPSRISDAWTNDVSRNLYALQLQSPGKSLTITVPEPKHAIQLDIMGIATKDFDTKSESAVQYNRAYKAWLKESVSGQERVLTDVTAERCSKQGLFAVDDKDVFIQLFMGLSSKMAEQKR